MKRFSIFILLILLSLFPLWNLTAPGLPVTHDGPDHVARIANFYQSLAEGNPVPRWAGNLNWGFGHPILMFLYPLPSYIASMFHFVGFSLVDSVKLVFAAGFIASVITMYLWVKKEWGVLPAVVSAVAYGFAPYRFVDLYVRGAIGEHIAFIFPPLILLGIVGIARGKRVHIWGSLTSVATASLLLSHNAVSLMVLPVVFLYTAYLYVTGKLDTGFLIRAVLFIGIGFLLSSFFWVPAFLEGKYTLRDIVTGQESLSRFVPFPRFIFSPWNYGGTAMFSKEIGLAQWVIVLLAGWFGYSTKNKKLRSVLYLLLGIFAGSLFLMTEASKLIWQTFTILQKFQFPWRFLTLNVFSAAALGGIIIVCIPKHIQRFAVAVLLISMIVTTAHMWKASQYRVYPESFFMNIYDSTTDTGESSPVWSVRFMEHRFSLPLEVIEGVAETKELERTSTYHHYTVRTSLRSRMVENTLYFPGWNILVDNEPVAVEFQDSRYRGLMTFWLDTGVHDVKVIFTDTKLRLFANALSVFGIALLVTAYYAVLFKKI